MKTAIVALFLCVTTANALPTAAQSRCSSDSARSAVVASQLNELDRRIDKAINKAVSQGFYSATIKVQGFLPEVLRRKRLKLMSLGYKTDLWIPRFDPLLGQYFTIEWESK